MLRLLGILILLLATTAIADIIHLDDGSQLAGEVISLDAETLILNTEFAGELSLDRNRVRAILLDEDFAVASVQVPVMTGAALEPEEKKVEGIGILEVSIKGDPVKSSVRYRQEDEAANMLLLNTIHMRIYVDGYEYAHVSDSQMDKEFNQGKWRVLRNAHRFDPVEFEVPAGRHRIQIVVGNDLGVFENDGDQEILSAEVIVEEVDIIPGQKTRVTVKGKGGRLGTYGRYEMELLSSR
jgi:hypothetical protein